MRLVVLCLEWPSRSRHVGGVGRYAFRLTTWLGSRAEVSVVTGPDPEPLAGVDLHPVEPGMFKDRMTRHYVAPLAAARLVAALKPDVIHSHGDDAYLAWAPGHAPILRTYYGRAAAEARSGRWQRQANHVVLALLEHSVRHRVARAVAIGPDSATAYRTHALIPPVLPDDLPDSVGRKGPEPTMVFIGGFDGRKRGGMAARAVERLRRRGAAVQFTVFGPPADKERYPAWVDFRSGAPDAEVRAALAGAWILLAPSTYEGFGIPAWEAMGAGAVVVGTPTPGMTFLAAGDAAVLVDDVRFDDAVAALTADGEARSAIQARARARAEEIAGMADPGRYLRLAMELA
jgi:glycosyltransferase involved in cell wall biosynthesis